MINLTLIIMLIILKILFESLIIFEKRKKIIQLFKQKENFFN